MSNPVKMKAIDTLHISSVGPNAMQPGQEFEISDTFADDLEKRGLAKRLGAAKKDPAPANKMEDAPVNKAEPAPVSSASVKGTRAKRK